MAEKTRVGYRIFFFTHTLQISNFFFFKDLNQIKFNTESVSGRFRRSTDDAETQSALLGGHSFVRTENVRRTRDPWSVHKSVFLHRLDRTANKTKLIFPCGKRSLRMIKMSFIVRIKPIHQCVIKIKRVFFF